jgi:hypothetical protein
MVGAPDRELALDREVGRFVPEVVDFVLPRLEERVVECDRQLLADTCEARAAEPEAVGEPVRVRRDRVDFLEPLRCLELRGDEVVDLLDRVLAALGRLEHRVAVLGLRRVRDVAEGEAELLLGVRPRVLRRAVGVVEGPRVSLVVGTAARGCQHALPWTARATSLRRASTSSSFTPTSDDLHRTRLAMDGVLPTARASPSPALARAGLQLDPADDAPTELSRAAAAQPLVPALRAFLATRRKLSRPRTTGVAPS